MTIDNVSRSADQVNPWSVVALCTIAYIMSFIDRQILALLIGPVRASLGISDTQFGLLIGLAFSMFYATMGIPVAGLADRASRPLLIAGGVLFWSLATMACGLARSFDQLFIARICVGAGEAALTPAAYSLFCDLFERRVLGRVLAVYSLGTLIGSGIAFLVGAAVIAAISGAGQIALGTLTIAPWQAVFLVVGAPGIVLSAIIALTVKEPRRMVALSPQDKPPALLAILRFIRTERAIFAPMLIGFSLAAMSLFALLGWAPAFLMREFALSPRAAGAIMGLVAIVFGGGGNLASGWLIDRLARDRFDDAPFRVGLIGAIGVIAPAAAIPFAHGLVATSILLAAALFFASFPMAPSAAIMQIASPPTMRSRVSAIFLFCNSLGGLALGSALVGLINDRLYHGIGTGRSMAIVAAGAAVLACPILNMGRKPFARAHPN